MSVNLNCPTTLDNDVLASIRRAVGQFLQRCGLQYMDTAIDEAFYSELCQEAINRGIPLDGDYSIRAYMAIGVAMLYAYHHLPDRATRVWIGLFTAVVAYIDDMMNKGDDLVHMYSFNERFASYQLQGNPVLNALDALMRDTARHYSPLVSNLIVTSSLEFISSILLDNETKDMEVSARTPLYSEYSRSLSGLSSAYAFYIFPSTLPPREYVQCIPYARMVINHANDILSYYKEEFEGDTANYLSLMAASRAVTKQDALHEVIERTVQAHHDILEFLRPYTEAYNAYVSFFDGYVKFHAALRRYKLEEIMSESSLS